MYGKILLTNNGQQEHCNSSSTRIAAVLFFTPTRNTTGACFLLSNGHVSFHTYFLADFLKPQQSQKTPYLRPTLSGNT